MRVVDGVVTEVVGDPSNPINKGKLCVKAGVASVEGLRSVTTDDVCRVLHRVLDTPRTLAAVGPFNAEQLVA